MVTIAGDSHRSRVGVSVLSSVGCTGFIAASTEEYLRIAVETAADREKLAGVRRTLREKVRNSRLVDAAAFTKSLEAAYKEIWADFCSR